MFSENVYCFTPGGRCKEPAEAAPRRSTLLTASTALLVTAWWVRVSNDKLVPIDYQIQNGDRIEVITSQNSKGPSRDWLKIVKSTQARNKINQWFREQNKEDNIIKGTRSDLDRYCKAKGLNLSESAEAGVPGEGCAQVRLPRLGFCCRCDWSRRYEGRPGQSTSSSKRRRRRSAARSQTRRFCRQSLRARSRC